MRFFVFIFFSALLALTVANAEAVGTPPSESIYNLKSSWKTQDQNDILLGNFRGDPAILAMIYTSCRGACPMLILDIQNIERALSKNSTTNVHFVLVSFDSENDSPKKLKDYAKAHHLDLSRWTLLQGSQKEIRELAAALDIRFKKIDDGGFEHSNVITLLDAEGIIKYRQVGLKNDPQNIVTVVQGLAKILKK